MMALFMLAQNDQNFIEIILGRFVTSHLGEIFSMRMPMITRIVPGSEQNEQR